jgi:crossover junction endodeoxyribonuclease RuvC
MVILGVDPGLHATGFGAIVVRPDRPQVLAAGAICPPKKAPMAERLERIHAGLAELITRHAPHTLVLEKVFTHYQHVTTAALMAHARGVACLVAQEHRIALAEYPTTQVKKTITGNGMASKEQVSRMVGQWLNYRDPSWTADATDALALALIHAHMLTQRRNLPAGVA